MSRAYVEDARVLAIDPSTRGFGFAILEGPNRLIDWGVKETKTDKKTRSLKLITDLIEQYQPSVIVVEDYAAKGSRRRGRVRDLINEVAKLAGTRNVKVRSFSRLKVKQTFAAFGASTKYEISMAIAKPFSRTRATFTAFQKTLDERGLPDEHF